MRFTLLGRGALLGALAVLFLVRPVAAQTTFVWDGGGGNLNWGLAGNWEPNGAPANATASFVFDAANVTGTQADLWRPNNNLSGLTFTGLTIRGSRPEWTNNPGGGWDIRGGTHVLSGDVTASGGTHRYGGASTLGADVTVNVVDQSLSWSSNIAESGSRSLIKTGAGTLVLSGSPAYSGTTTINGGVLEFSGANSTGDNSAMELAGGTVRFSGGGTRSNTISGTGNLEKTGANTLVLAGTNSYTGTTHVLGGALLITGDSSAATGSLMVSPGATFGGSGQFGGEVWFDVGARLPLTLGATLTLAPAGQFFTARAAG
ncbi:MAG: autotransporter-associated beta strand repeat-containing protein [Chthoniobacterales bacterium]